jgi:hypothetical protein
MQFRRIIFIFNALVTFLGRHRPRPGAHSLFRFWTRKIVKNGQFEALRRLA